MSYETLKKEKSQVSDLSHSTLKADFCDKISPTSVVYFGKLIVNAPTLIKLQRNPKNVSHC